MEKTQKQAYEPPEALKSILSQVLAGRRFRLECGHHITFLGGNLANDLTIRNGSAEDLKVICAQCGY